MSAIVLAFSVFPVGSKVLAVRDLYGGSFRWFNQVEQEGRFHFTYANTEEELIAELEKDVDVLYIETPTNPLMLEFDIEKLAKLAHAKGAKVVVDNTFYSPIYQRPIEDGADIVLHSATKYLAGHNDVLAGVVVTNSLELYEKLFTISIQQGQSCLHLTATSCFVVSRPYLFVWSAQQLTPKKWLPFEGFSSS